MATNRYVDSTTGDNADDGSTPALAWDTIEYALESGTLAADYNVWVRRLHTETPGSNIVVVYGGSAKLPLYVIGWPRAAIPNTTITGADWTNGSNLVDNVTGITPDRKKHIGRYCTAPDGKIYLITAILWGFTVDGMAAGDEFAVSEILTNTTQTKKGKVWAFTDNLDTTGTIQAVVDSSSAWVNNDNITSDGGGDAELSGDATAVGFLIDREYPGGTVTGVNGKFQIEADEEYTNRPQAGKDAGWDADAIDLPEIDFAGGGFYLDLTSSGSKYLIIENLEIKSTAAKLVKTTYMQAMTFLGCLFKGTYNDELFDLSRGCHYIKRTIIEGSGSGSNQIGFLLSAATTIFSKDIAIFNCGDCAFKFNSTYKSELKNTNIGIEMCNGDDDIYVEYSYGFIGNDVALGGTNGYVQIGGLYQNVDQRVSIGNFQKVLGDHVTWFCGGSLGLTGGFSNVDVGDANAPSAASPAGSTTDLIAIYPNVSGYELKEDWAICICKWKIWAAAAAETYTVYLQNNMGVTLNDTAARDDVWLKLTYINAYDDASEYNKVEIFSTEIDILQRADQTDWDSLTIANHTPAVAGWAILELFVSKYVASGQIYVDPKWT